MMIAQKRHNEEKQVLPTGGRTRLLMRKEVAVIIRRIRGEIHSWGSRILPPGVDKKRRRTHSWGNKTLPPGVSKRRSIRMDRCTELSEEHILLGKQRAATRVYEVLRESFVRRIIGAPAEDLEIPTPRDRAVRPRCRFGRGGRLPYARARRLLRARSVYRGPRRVSPARGGGNRCCLVAESPRSTA